VPGLRVTTIPETLTTVTVVALLTASGDTPEAATVGTLASDLLDFGCWSGCGQQCGTSQKQVSNCVLHEFHLLRSAAMDTLCSSANSLLQVTNCSLNVEITSRPNP
jgi:hypothetical protein